jgi:hypothetical protein
LPGNGSIINIRGNQQRRDSQLLCNSPASTIPRQRTDELFKMVWYSIGREVMKGRLQAVQVQLSSRQGVLQSPGQLYTIRFDDKHIYSIIYTINTYKLQINNYKDVAIYKNAVKIIMNQIWFDVTSQRHEYRNASTFPYIWGTLLRMEWYVCHANRTLYIICAIETAVAYSSCLYAGTLTGHTTNVRIQRTLPSRTQNIPLHYVSPLLIHQGSWTHTVPLLHLGLCLQICRYLQHQSTPTTLEDNEDTVCYTYLQKTH